MQDVKNPGGGADNLHFLDYWRIVRIRKWVILSIFLLVVTTTTIVTLWLPKQYMSEVRMVVKKDSKSAPSLFEQNRLDPSYDPYFLQTQFEMIQSQEILYQVIEDLGLNAAWAKRYGNPVPFDTADTYHFLKKRMKVSQIRNTEYIEVRVYSEDSEEAARIANRLAEVYRETRLEKLRKTLASGVDTLEIEKVERDKEVKAMQAKLDALRKELEFIELAIGDAGPSVTLDSDSLRRLESEKITAQTKFEEAEKTVTELESKTRAHLERAIITVHFDPPLANLLTDKATAELEVTNAKKDFGEKHPSVERAEAALGKINEMITDRVEGIMDGLRVNRDKAKTKLDAQTRAVEEARKKFIELTNKSAPYHELKRELEHKKALLQTLEVRIQQTKIDSVLSSGDIVMITDQAQPSEKPARPNIPLNIALGVVVGLVAGFGLAFFIEYLDTSVKTIDDVERTLGAPVLSVIPQNVGSLLDEGADSPHAEAYRVLRTNIMFGRKDDRMNTLTVVSGGAGEGKSTTVFNLATIFAQSGGRVLLVDSDLRRPSLHKVLGVSNSIGLTSMLMGQHSPEEVIQTTPQEGLDFLPSGKLPSSAMGILNSPQMREFVDDVRKRYDFVLFDAPPIMGVSDASILASMMDMTVLVIQYRKYPQAMTVRAKQTVDKVGGNLLGVVMNNINISQDAYYYYYGGFQYGTYTRDDEQKPADERNGNRKRGKPATPGAGLKQDSDRINLKDKY